MNLKEVLLYLFLSVVFSIWLSLLLAVYIPTTSWGTIAFPLSIDSTLKTMFLVSTVLLMATSVLIGMEKLGILSRLYYLVGHHKEK
jgi:hypothetical protein